MAPSLFKLVGAAVVVAVTAHASATKSYKVSEIYNSTNFFDKFDFVSKIDPTGGYIQYQDRANAESLGLVKYQDDEVYIGVDYTSGDYNPGGVGRKSVRLESKKVYNHGLIIADFTHFPEPVCGSWPAYWFFGEPWPTKGEVDVYENWNDLAFNRYSSHVDSPEAVGECTLVENGMKASIDTSNCYNYAEGQPAFEGCSAIEQTTTFGSAFGGILAMEWTQDHVKIWNWPRHAAPSDVLSGKPHPSFLWGLPSFLVKKCDIDKAFKDLKMVLNIDFCGVAGQAGNWAASCQAKTGCASCTEYVAENPGDFESVNFKIKDIRIYEQVEISTSSTKISSASNSTTHYNSTATTTSSANSSTSASGSSPYAVLPSSSSSSSGELALTTSTIYATSVHTITSCAPTVTNCPAGGYVTTEPSQ
ncbi:concanavalin A-like lectin/glucanase domain-containing protein [Hypoxylon sp. NC1633]|nr:concanavalin A-like lectin/glucanase domain-containing protein [Hypoxylon sp. NC1633]